MAGAGIVIGGALGWLAGISALAIPGVGPFIAAGPIISALAGVGAGATVGGIAGALIGMGVPEYEAKRYEGLVNKGGILLSVHPESSGETMHAKEIWNIPARRISLQPKRLKRSILKENALKDRCLTQLVLKRSLNSSHMKTLKYPLSRKASIGRI